MRHHVMRTEVCSLLVLLLLATGCPSSNDDDSTSDDDDSTSDDDDSTSDDDDSTSDDDDSTGDDDDSTGDDDDSTSDDDDSAADDDDSAGDDDDSAGDDDDDDDTVSELDQDGDGYSPATGDCDDGNPFISPVAPEVCFDGVDDDCSGVDPSPFADGGADLVLSGQVTCNRDGDGLVTSCPPCSWDVLLTGTASNAPAGGDLQVSWGQAFGGAGVAIDSPTSAETSATIEVAMPSFPTTSSLSWTLVFAVTNCGDSAAIDVVGVAASCESL